MKGPILLPLIKWLVACLSYLRRTSRESADTLNSCCAEIGGTLVPELVVAVGIDVGVVQVPFAKSTMSC